MKKFFAFLAAGLFLTACSSEDFNAPEQGTEQEVTLTFQLPEAIASRAANGGSNSALGGASNCSGNITFTAALYYNGKEIWRDNAATAIPNANASVTFKPTLVLGEEYQLVAYAQLDGEVDDLTNVTELNAINNEKVDAYYVSTMIQAQPSMSATLKRATGKLRIIADDFAATEKQLGKTIEKVTVTYRQAQPISFNPTTGEWAAEASDVTFSEVVTEEFKYTTEGDSKTLLVDYIPATANGEIINIESVVVTFSDNTTFTKNLSTLDIPVKRNYLTTLRGNFFTAEMELTLQIDDAFEGEEEVNYEFAAAFENGGYLVLSEDVALDKKYTVAAGKTVVLDLNGKNITSTPEGNIAIAIEKGGKLIINGEGSVSTDATLLYAGYGDLVINGGKHHANLEVIEMNGAAAVINGGEFSAAQAYNGNYWLLNLKDNTGASIAVKGGAFTNFNPADNVCEGKGTNFVAEGYASYEKEAGVWEVVKGTVVNDAASLASAVAQGGNVILGADVTIDETLVVKGTATLCLNGKTLTNKVDNAKTDVIVVEAGANLTINGIGNVTAVSGNDGYAVISAGVLTINGGNFSSGLDANNDGNAVIYARGNGEVYINGGHFQNNGDDSTFVINKKDGDRATTTISIKGGTYVNFNPADNAAEGAGTNFVAEGYKVVANGTIYEVVAE